MPLTQLLSGSLGPTAIAVVIPLAFIAILFCVALIKTRIADYRALEAKVSAKDAEIAALNTEIERLNRPKLSFSQRASLQIVGMRFVRDPFEPNAPIYINVLFRNIGPIPAEKLAAAYRIAIVPSSSGVTALDEIEAQNTEHKKLATLVSEASSRQEYGLDSVMPGQEKSGIGMYPLEKDTPITKEQIEQVKSRRKAIAIAGVLKYMDEYGPRETHFCNTFHGPNPQSPSWSDCCCHNEIVSSET